MAVNTKKVAAGPAKKAAGKTKAVKPARKKTTPKLEAVEEPKPRGRPTIYTPEIAAEICARISNGESTRAIAKDMHMPCEGTIRAWAVDNAHGFFAQYTRAVQIRAMGWAEEIIEIGDDGSNDSYTDPNSGIEKINHEVVARSRLRVDSRKWMLSKVLPKIYGDKLDLNHGLQPDNPLAKLFDQIKGTPLRPAGEKK